jgi:hypothetical protein
MIHKQKKTSTTLTGYDKSIWYGAVRGHMGLVGPLRMGAIDERVSIHGFVLKSP